MAPKRKSVSKKKSKKKSSAKARPKPKAQKPAKKKSKKLARKPPRSSPSSPNEAAPIIKGRGARTAGQSGDTEGLSDTEDVDSESVEELIEEGQDFEGELVEAVENAPDPDEGELDTEVPENDEDPDVRSFTKRNRL
jgi:hypothetical protein